MRRVGGGPREEMAERTSKASYEVRVRGCKELKDAPSTYWLYPGTCLYYELVVVDKSSGAESSVLRRFSEVRKFWEAVRPFAAAVGAPLEPFPAASAFMSGGGYTGNLYETNPNSDFAGERLEVLRALLATFAAKTDATGGSLLDLKASKTFFELDSSPETAVPTKIINAERHLDTADEDRPKPSFRPEPLLASLTRSTPAAFLTVFVVVLAALYAFTPPRDD
mmetsp:Transcript_10546/g.33709  ORF Transcript_10546/g.33709 Transcript_10546/m.33709 type:complete len:223 (-) Transcript_10546:139-807(-)